MKNKFKKLVGSLIVGAVLLVGALPVSEVLASSQFDKIVYDETKLPESKRIAVIDKHEHNMFTKYATLVNKERKARGLNPVNLHVNVKFDKSYGMTLKDKYFNDIKVVKNLFPSLKYKEFHPNVININNIYMEYDSVYQMGEFMFKRELDTSYEIGTFRPDVKDLFIDIVYTDSVHEIFKGTMMRVIVLYA